MAKLPPHTKGLVNPARGCQAFHGSRQGLASAGEVPPNPPTLSRPAVLGQQSPALKDLFQEPFPPPGSGRPTTPFAGGGEPLVLRSGLSGAENSSLLS